MADTLTALPTVIVAGDSVSVRRELPDYPADQGWVLTYALLAKGQSPQKFDATAEGSAHRLDLLPTHTALLNAGLWHWTAIIAKGTALRVSLESGELRILPDPLNPPAGYDPRPWCVRALEAVEKALEGSLEDGVTAFEIRGTKIEQLTPDALRRERVRLLQEVRLSRGCPLVGMLGVRLS
jgi:hypothetical protein